MKAADPVDDGADAVAVDVAVLTITDGGLSVLLVRRSGEPGMGRWSRPGSHARTDEGLEAAARRALVERAGLADLRPVGHMEQLRTYGDPARDARGRVLSVGYVMFVPDPPAAPHGSWRPAAGAAAWPSTTPPSWPTPWRCEVSALADWAGRATPERQSTDR